MKKLIEGKNTRRGLKEVRCVGLTILNRVPIKEKIKWGLSNTILVSAIFAFIVLPIFVWAGF